MNNKVESFLLKILQECIPCPQLSVKYYNINLMPRAGGGVIHLFIKNFICTRNFNDPVNFNYVEFDTQIGVNFHEC